MGVTCTADRRGASVWWLRPWAALVGAVLLVACDATVEVDLSLVGVTVVDVESGRLQPASTVEITGGQIVRVVAAGEARRPARRREDLDGAYVLAGLWDMHVHALWDEEVAMEFLPAFTRAGVTGIRDMGGNYETLRRARAVDDPSWPRIFAAGRILDGPRPVDPTISEAVADAPGARAAVKRLRQEGADFVKVYTLLPRQAFFAAARQATAEGMGIAGHVPAEVTPREAAEAGLASIEHLRDELGGLCAGFDEAECHRLLGVLSARGTRVTPTLAVIEAKSIPGYSTDPAGFDLKSLPAAVSSYWREAAEAQPGRGEAYFTRRRRALQDHRRMLRKLAAAGVPMLAGSDAGNPFLLPGESLHRELELMVEAGLTPREALYSATLGAARFLGLEGVGRVVAGQAADLVVLAADPLQEIGRVRDVLLVVRAGRVLQPAAPQPPAR